MTNHFRSLNSCILIGHVGQDAKIKPLANERAMLTFSLATRTSVKDASGAWQSVTMWHNCVLFGTRLEKFADRIAKGALLSVRGSISYRDVKDENGRSVRYTDIVVDDFQCLADPKVKASPKVPAPVNDAPELPPEEDIAF